MVASAQLIDVARDHLGDDPYFTSHHKVAGGTTQTRIDQIYAPDLNGITWEHKSDPTDIFPRRRNPGELDHEMLEVRVATIKGDKGRDLERIDESIFDDVLIVTHLFLFFPPSLRVSHRECSVGPRSLWVY